MDKARRVAYGEYLRELANKMELRDWTITASELFCAEDADADMEVIQGKRVILIRFCPGFDKRSPEENRLTCVHELLHAHTWGMREAFRNVAGPEDAKWVDLLWRQCDLADEYAVSAIAEIIAPFMPLPPAFTEGDDDANHARGRNDADQGGNDLPRNDGVVHGGDERPDRGPGDRVPDERAATGEPQGA